MEMLFLVQSLTIVLLLLSTVHCHAFTPFLGSKASSPLLTKLNSAPSDAIDLDTHQLHWLDPFPNTEKCLGEAIAQGEVVICIPEMASEDECAYLTNEGLKATQNAANPAARGRSRFSVSDPNSFSSDVVFTSEEILLRVLDYLDDNIPIIYDTLFKPSQSWVTNQPLDAQLEEVTVPPSFYLSETCISLRDLYMMGELEWSEGEPAINIYQSGGYFGCHKDHLALTVLIPLTSPHKFINGGTGFWAGNRDADENPFDDADLVLAPTEGSALIFGGDVPHSGMPINAGYRSVFVCSFSTRTEVSSPDRLHGLQAPPQVSPNFKGSM